VTVIHYSNTMLKIVHCLKYIRDSDSLYQDSVVDFIVWNVSVTVIRYTHTVLKIVRCL